MIENRKPPKRLAVIVRLAEVLEQISKEQGDAFTMAGKVFRNRILIGAEVTENPPALAIIESPRPDAASFAGEGNQARRDSWTIMVQGIAADNRKNSGDDVYYLCQDVERRLLRISDTKGHSGTPLYPDVYLLGGMITAIEIAPPVIRPPEAGVANNSFFYLPIRLGMAAEIGE